MSVQRVLDEKVAEMRRRVQMAFKELRRMGFIAKSNFACCMSCAVAELQDIGNEKRRNKAVYWHRQDEGHFRETGLLNIRYCYIPTKGIEGDTTCVEHHIGEQVAMALRKAGLEIQWDGDPGKVIEVVGLSQGPISEKEETNGNTT
jgi:hypothetical protein